jgi:hypothetical protein
MISTPFSPALDILLRSTEETIRLQQKNMRLMAQIMEISRHLVFVDAAAHPRRGSDPTASVTEDEI